jgi:hypothetical protein
MGTEIIKVIINNCNELKSCGPMPPPASINFGGEVKKSIFSLVLP